MRLLILAMWVGWLAYWTVAARGNKATQWREPMRANWLHYALAWIGTIVLVVPQATPAILRAPFLPPGATGAVLGIVLTAMGLGTAIAARITLAGNWSAAVEIKEDHALIRSGPYRYVRHPIYSGLLLAVLGSAIALDRWCAVLGFVLIFASLLLKARHEENRLREVMPDYAAYASETAALIPFLL
jgi:protein-S-isoprenylcysteine O-methyltransferase Ste14